MTDYEKLLNKEVLRRGQAAGGRAETDAGLGARDGRPAQGEVLGPPGQCLQVAEHPQRAEALAQGAGDVAYRASNHGSPASSTSSCDARRAAEAALAKLVKGGRR